MCKRKILQAIFAISFGLSLACGFMARPQPQLTEQPPTLATAGPIFTNPPVPNALIPYETSTPQPTLVFPPGMPTPQLVATLPPRAETFGDAKLSDATGKVTFEDSLAFKRLNVQVQDDVKNQPLEQIHVQYISDGNEFLIVALDPTGHYFPAIQSGTLSSLGTAPRDRNDIVSFGVSVVEAAPPPQGWETLEIVLKLVEVFGTINTLQDLTGLLRNLPSLSSWTSSSRTYCLTGEQVSNALGLLISAGEAVILPISGAAVFAGPEGLLLAAMVAMTFHTADLDVEAYFLNHPGPYGIRFSTFAAH